MPAAVLGRVRGQHARRRRDVEGRALRLAALHAHLHVVCAGLALEDVARAHAAVRVLRDAVLAAAVGREQAQALQLGAARAAHLVRRRGHLHGRGGTGRSVRDASRAAGAAKSKAGERLSLPTPTVAQSDSFRVFSLRLRVLRRVGRGKR